MKPRMKLHERAMAKTEQYAILVRLVDFAIKMYEKMRKYFSADSTINSLN